MALRTQVDPYVLIGDSLADLPPPGPPNEGVLFHEEATGECRILVRDAATGLWRWEPFCAGITGPTGPTGATGPGGFFMKFQGVLDGNEQGSSAILTLTDGGVPMLLPAGYPALLAATSLTFAVHAESNTVTDSPTRVRVLVNGVPVPGTQTDIPAGTAGLIQLTTVPVALAIGDLIDVDAQVLTASPGSISITVTLLFQA